MQASRIEQHLSVLDRIDTAIANIHNDVNTEIANKLAAYRRRHRQLARKLLKIASTVELAACSADSSGLLTQREIDRKKRLDTIARALAAPAEFKDKLSDLVELADATVLDRNIQPPVEIRDPRAAVAIKQLLTDQLAGIQHLGTVCDKTNRDLSIMSNLLQER